MPVIALARYVRAANVTNAMISPPSECRNFGISSLRDTPCRLRVRRAGNRIYNLDAEIGRIAERQLFPGELPLWAGATFFCGRGRREDLS